MKVREFDQVNYYMGLARAPVCQGEKVIREVVKRMCTGYIFSMRAQTIDLCDLRNTLLTDAQL